MKNKVLMNTWELQSYYASEIAKYRDEDINKEKQNTQTYCYKPYRTLRNY